jgi:putative transposase
VDKFIEGNFYHVYNRGVDRISTFREQQDFKHFLDFTAYYLYPVSHIYAYCLLPNHFHILLKVRNEGEQRDIFDRFKEIQNESWKPYGLQFPTFKELSISRQLGHLFNRYTKYFNKKYERSGILFDRTVKRKVITSEEYLRQLVCYIHRNPLHHGIKANYHEYDYSSYNRFLSASDSILEREEVVTWFGDKENFVEAHLQMKLSIESELLFDE